MKRLSAKKKLTGIFLTLLLLLTVGLVTACQKNASLSAKEAVVTFDTAPGIYQTRFSLTLSVSDPSLSVYYTIDANLPSTEAELYDPEKGISIVYRGGGGNDPSSVNIIRAAAFDKDGNQVSETITGTYILTDVPETRYSTMIVSLVSEPDGLYGYTNGILVPGKIRDDFLKNRPSYWTNNSLQNANYFQSGIDWERPAHIECYTASGELLLSQNIGMRVSGGWNRNNAHKSLRLFARYTYDDTNVMHLDAYPGYLSSTGLPITDHKTLILRTGSNNIGNTTIQTQFLMQLGDEVGLDTMHYRPVCVYLNGKYYGYMAMLEDYSSTYFETHYNLPSENITCINGAGYIDGRTRDWQLDCGPTSELTEYRRMLNYITSLDMTNEKYYKIASEMLDFDNFIKYMCFQGYIANSDWPQNNVRLWRYNGGRNTDGSAVDGYDQYGYNPDATEYGKDGRWRFLLKDLDLSAGYGDGVTESIFKRLNSDDGGLRLNAIFKSLFKNADFKNRVYCFLCDLLSTTMEVENVMAKLGEVEASAAVEMLYYARSYNASGSSNEKWHNYLRTPANFFKVRHTVVENELSKKYGSSYGSLNVSVIGNGTVHVSTLSLTEDTDLSYLIGLKIPLSAEPDNGWHIKSVKLNGKTIDTEKVTNFTMSAKESTLTVEFEEDTAPVSPFAVNAYGIYINEVKYNHSSGDTSPDKIELYNAGDKAVYLKGWTLRKNSIDEITGQPEEKTWNFPAVVLNAGEYMVLRCIKGTAVRDSEGYIVTYGISVGSTLTMIDRMGNTVDFLTLPDCNNFSVYAKGEYKWDFEPEATFGSKNVFWDGYDLSSMLDDRAFHTFIHKGRFVSNFAEKSGDTYVISESSIKKNFSTELFDNNRSKFQKSGNGYDLDSVLSAFGYKRWYIPSLDSNVIFKN